MSVLYITQNGITDHIGRSQVAPYVLALAKRGFGIHVLSAEKPGQEPLIENYQKAFRDAGVRWTRIPYRRRPPVLGQLITQAEMERAARRIVKTESIRIVHCRSFPPALIGYRLHRCFGTKYVFDFRDFYADGGLDKARGLSRLFYRYFKRMEGPMIRAAGGIVCLTHKAQAVLTERHLADLPGSSRRFMVIPCCADFEHFNPDCVTPVQQSAARERAGLVEGDFVLLYLGSLGPDYLLDEMIALFRQLRVRRPDARFLFVCNNGRELIEETCGRQGVDMSAVRIVAADRDEIPAFIMLAELSVIFIRPVVAKAGCSPTKLAELLACNVPVIANAGVGDLDQILSIAVNGSVAVPDFQEETLGQAIDQVLNSRAARPLDIRAASWHFGLDEGVQRYAKVYDQLLGALR